MPKLGRPDGVEIHWEECGTGPLVVIAVQWSGHPIVFGPLVDELSVDHRVVSYDARGTGESTRVGPHDLATGADDLAALLTEVGAPAVVVAMTDSCNRAVKVAARQPALIQAIVAPDTVPLPRHALDGTEALIASDSVVEAFLQMLERDYRGAQRTMMTIANPQMTEPEIRDRVNLQVAYCPRDTALARVRAWRDDDPLAPAREIDGKLWLLSFPGAGAGWWPTGPALEALIEELLPDAHLEHVEDGVVSRPDLTAQIVRRLTAAP